MHRMFWLEDQLSEAQCALERERQEQDRRRAEELVRPSGVCSCLAVSGTALVLAEEVPSRDSWGAGGTQAQVGGGAASEWCWCRWAVGLAAHCVVWFHLAWRSWALSGMH